MIKHTLVSRPVVASPRIIYAALLFCVVLAGAGFVAFVPSHAPLFWKSVSCEVLQFEVEDRANAELPFTAKTRFRFEWQGGVRDVSALGIDGWKESEIPYALKKRFAEDPEARCYFPGLEPRQAVLIRPQPKWGGLFFIGFGVCVGWILLQAHRFRDKPLREISRQILPAVALLFAGCGGVPPFLGISLPVWVESIQAQNWEEKPATVIWSKVRVTRGSKHTNYRADICYEYQIAGKVWRSNRVSSGNLLGSSGQSAREMVAAYRPGFHTRCWVHPAKGEKAVLIRNPGWAILLTLFPLPFLGVGLLCVRQFIHSGRH